MGGPQPPGLPRRLPARRGQGRDPAGRRGVGRRRPGRLRTGESGVRAVLRTSPPSRLGAHPPHRPAPAGGGQPMTDAPTGARRRTAPRAPRRRRRLTRSPTTWRGRSGPGQRPSHQPPPGPRPARRPGAGLAARRHGGRRRPARRHPGRRPSASTTRACSRRSCPRRRRPAGYQLAVTYEAGEFVVDDPYRFWPTLGDLDLYLYGEGRHETLWRVMGAHLREHQGVAGAVVRGVGPVGPGGAGGGRLQRLGRPHAPDAHARVVGRLGAVRPRGRGRPPLQVRAGGGRRVAASSRPTPSPSPPRSRPARPPSSPPRAPTRGPTRSGWSGGRPPTP